MLKKKGIALKTFLFTSILIALVVIISFAGLYFVLPDYYSYTKRNKLEANTERLVRSLEGDATKEECAELITVFASENNAEVMAFDSQNVPILDMSSPFIMMSGNRRVKMTVELLESDMKGFTTTSVKGIATPNAEEIERDGTTDIKVAHKNDDNIVWFYTSTGTVTGATSSLPVITFSHGDIHNTSAGDISIIVTSTLQPIDEAKDVIISLIPFLLFVDIIIALIAAYFYSKRLTDPIIRISDAASQMQLLTPDIVSGVRTNDELGELSENLDVMYKNLWSNMEELQIEMKRVEELERSKTDFMRAASHELKTPIAALNGITEGMIDNVGVYKNKEKYLEESKRLIKQMAVLVSEILSASKLDNIDEAMDIEQIDVQDVLSEALSRHELIIEEKRLSVSAADFNYIYKTDERMLLNVLSNIISNACKYTNEEGKVIISFAVGAGEAVLSIENECQPIPEEELDKLFEPFFTLNYSRNRSKSGTGLGLYIAKRNLDRMNLAYKLENTGLGVRFSIVFI